MPKEEVPQVIAAQRSHGADPSASIGAELPHGRHDLRLQHLSHRAVLHRLPRHGDAAPGRVQGAEGRQGPGGPPGHLQAEAGQVRDVPRREREDPLLRQLPPRHCYRLRVQRRSSRGPTSTRRRSPSPGSSPARSAATRRSSASTATPARTWCPTSHKQSSWLRPEDADRHGVRREAGRAVGQPRARGAEVDGVVRGLPR